MKKKLFLIPLAMFMTAGAVGMAGCGEKKPEPTPQTQTLESIDVTKQPTKLVYQVGETFDPAGLEVQAKYSDGSTKVLAGTEYTISPLTALTAESKVITIEYQEGGVTRYAEIDITVVSGEIVPVTAIKYTLEPQKYTIEIGEEIKLSISVEPEEATVKTVTYEFSEEGIVSIEDGKIKGLKAGKTDIIIKSASNPEITKKISGFTVKEADAAVPSATAAGFEKFTEGALKNGETINIAAVYGDKIFGMGALAGTFVTPTELAVDASGKLVVGEALNYKALLNNDGTYSLKDSNGKFLSLAASGNNIAIKDAIDDDCKFVIGHGENETTTIVGANTAKESRFLVYNAGNPRFSFYKESTASGYPQLIVYHDGQEAEEKKVTGVAFKAESYTVESGFTVSVAAGVLPEDATDQEIAYSLEDVEPAGCATISGNVITGVAEGSAKVVAKSHDGGFEARVSLTVTPEQVPQHAGTEADPFTGADAMLIARKLAHKEVTESTYYIKDTVTKTESFDPNYGNYSFWFGDFECYRMWKNSLNNKFESADEIEVGDVVTVVAKITRYNQTLETAEKTGYTVNIQKPAIPATGVSLDKTELSMELGSIPQQLVATVAPEKASQEVTWTSSDETKVTVVDGLVTAVAVTEEPVIITATVVSDTSLTATCAVTVTPKTRTMTGITATGLEKTEYTEGEKLDLTGLVVQAIYDSGDPETISTGYTTNIALDHELELTDTSLVVSYNGFDADAITLTINAFQPIVEDGSYLLSSFVQAKAEDPLETYYFKNVGGDKPAGATALIADATPILIENVEEKQNVVTLKIGDNYLKGTATNNGLVFDTKPFEFTVVETELGLGSFELRFVDSGSKTRGITIYKASDGYVDLRCYEITSGSYKSGVGVIAPVVVDSISVTTQPTKTEYFVGDTFDPAGMVVEATLVGGSKSVVTTYSYPTDAFASEGTQDVVISFSGKTTTVSVSVAQKRTMTAIQITGSLSVAEYGVGEDYSLNGLKVEAVYDVGDPEVLDAAAYTLSADKEKAALGDASIVVTAHLNDETLLIADATKTCDVVVVIKSSIINDKKTGKTFVSTDPNTLTIDGIDMNTSGVKTGSGDAQDKNYGYFMMNKGYIASTSAKEGYYIAKVVVTYTSGTAVKGKVAIGLTAESNSALLTDGTTPEKSGTLVLTNDDQTKRYFNVSETSGNNTQVASIVIYWEAIAA